MYECVCVFIHSSCVYFDKVVESSERTSTRVVDDDDDDDDDDVDDDDSDVEVDDDADDGRVSLPTITSTLAIIDACSKRVARSWALDVGSTVRNKSSIMSS